MFVSKALSAVRQQWNIPKLSSWHWHAASEHRLRRSCYRMMSRTADPDYGCNRGARSARPALAGTAPIRLQVAGEAEGQVR